MPRPCPQLRRTISACSSLGGRAFHSVQGVLKAVCDMRMQCPRLLLAMRDAVTAGLRQQPAGISASLRTDHDASHFQKPLAAEVSRRRQIYEAKFREYFTTQWAGRRSQGAQEQGG
jgi:hypothetical protein